MSIKIKNVTTTISDGKNGMVTTTELIRRSLNVVPNGGYTREDFKIRDRIEACLDDKKDTIILEDSDANNLKKIVSEIRWSFRHEDLTKFLETIDNIKSM